MIYKEKIVLILQVMLFFNNFSIEIHNICVFSTVLCTDVLLHWVWVFPMKIITIVKFTISSMLLGFAFK